MNSLFHSAYPNGISRIENAQPKKIRYNTQTILEIPDTGVLADYVEPIQMIGHIKKALALATKKDIAVSIEFHIDTATQYIERIGAVIEAFAGQSRVKFVTCSEIRS